MLALCHTSSSCLAVLAEHALQLGTASDPSLHGAPVGEDAVFAVHAGVQASREAVQGQSEVPEHARLALEGVVQHGQTSGLRSSLVRVSPASGVVRRLDGQERGDWEGAEAHSQAFLQALLGQMQEQDMGAAAGRVLLRCMLLLQALWPLAGLQAEGDGA